MNNQIKDKIRGSLFAGGVGDAFGYPVEFMSSSSIFAAYGENGITKYELSGKNAIISDDTQMTLFTACGLLNDITKQKLNGSSADPTKAVYECYLDWFKTQYGYPILKKHAWISNIPELRVARAPGNTCLNALASGKCGTIENPLNRSKGCGGIMRIAPAALSFEDSRQAMIAAAEESAITHGHEMGYIPSAAVAYIINRLVYGEKNVPFETLVRESMSEVTAIFGKKSVGEYLPMIVDKALAYAPNGESDVLNIEDIGGGWTGDDAFAVAVYCVLRYGSDFDKVMISSVNHSGDSDSTGAIAGNIVGAMIGYDSIPEKWKSELELKDLILELADDIYTRYEDSDAWRKKYYI